MTGLGNFKTIMVAFIFITPKMKTINWKTNVKKVWFVQLSLHCHWHLFLLKMGGRGYIVPVSGKGLSGPEESKVRSRPDHCHTARRLGQPEGGALLPEEEPWRGEISVTGERSIQWPSNSLTGGVVAVERSPAPTPTKNKTMNCIYFLAQMASLKQSTVNSTLRPVVFGYSVRPQGLIVSEKWSFPVCGHTLSLCWHDASW